MEILIRHKLILITLGIQIIALPLMLTVVGQKQETRTQAAKITTISFYPSSDLNTPITKNKGENFSIDAMVDPGGNLISSAKIEILYDPTKISLSGVNPIVVNSAVFPQVIEGPTYSSGKIQLTLSVGADQTKALRADVKVLSLNLKAIAPTNQTNISYGTNNHLYSLQDLGRKNLVSASIIPATIKINASAGSTSR